MAPGRCISRIELHQIPQETAKGIKCGGQNAIPRPSARRAASGPPSESPRRAMVLLVLGALALSLLPTLSNHSGAFDARVGYDEASGLDSPVGGARPGALCGIGAMSHRLIGAPAREPWPSTGGQVAGAPSRSRRHLLAAMALVLAAAGSAVGARTLAAHDSETSTANCRTVGAFGPYGVVSSTGAAAGGPSCTAPTTP